MIAPSGQRRSYNSQRRRQQALDTRRSILDAAHRLFEADGYVSTTMEDIAGEAGVALKTVYSAFTTKGRLLRAVWDLLLKGDTDDAPVAQREWYLSVLAEQDPQRQLQLLAKGACAVKIRIGALLRVIRPTVGNGGPHSVCVSPYFLGTCNAHVLTPHLATLYEYSISR